MHDYYDIAKLKIKNNEFQMPITGYNFLRFLNSVFENVLDDEIKNLKSSTQLACILNDEYLEQEKNKNLSKFIFFVLDDNFNHFSGYDFDFLTLCYNELDKKDGIYLLVDKYKDEYLQKRIDFINSKQDKRYFIFNQKYDFIVETDLLNTKPFILENLKEKENNPYIVILFGRTLYSYKSLFNNFDNNDFFKLFKKNINNQKLKEDFFFKRIFATPKKDIKEILINEKKEYIKQELETLELTYADTDTSIGEFFSNDFTANILLPNFFEEINNVIVDNKICDVIYEMAFFNKDSCFKSFECFSILEGLRLNDN